MLKYRPEIDGLRAIAVLPVVLFHARIPGFSGGYLGVDLFFVISGYLITGLLLSDLEESGRISFGSFYERRARRILPGLFLVLSVSMVAALLILPPQPFAGFAKSVVTAVFFVANVYFLQTTNYFADPSELVPLLHLWSLAVEEQFYLIFPIALAITHRYVKHRLTLIFLIIAIVSFLMARHENAIDPARSFYLLHYRSWELLAGSTIAALPRLRSNWLGLFGLVAIIVAILLLGAPSGFGAGSVLVVLGTSSVLWSETKGVASKSLSFPPLIYVGSISYSLYLWHQPMFAFARHAMINAPGIGVMILLIVLSIVLAALSTGLVENPLRRSAGRTTIVALSLSASAALVIVSISIVSTDGVPGVQRRTGRHARRPS